MKHEKQDQFNAKFAKIVNNPITIAAFTCKEKDPHIAIVLHTICIDGNYVVCHIANLETGGFGGGVYGEVEARKSFLERVARYLA